MQSITYRFREWLRFKQFWSQDIWGDQQDLVKPGSQRNCNRLVIVVIKYRFTFRWSVGGQEQPVEAKINDDGQKLDIVGKKFIKVIKKRESFKKASGGRSV